MKLVTINGVVVWTGPKAREYAHKLALQAARKYQRESLRIAGIVEAERLLDGRVDHVVIAQNLIAVDDRPRPEIVAWLDNIRAETPAAPQRVWTVLYEDPEAQERDELDGLAHNPIWGVYADEAAAKAAIKDIVDKEPASGWEIANEGLTASRPGARLRAHTHAVKRS